MLIDDLKRDWNSSRNFDMGSWFDGTSLNNPATLLRNAEHSADVLSFIKDTKMRLWPIFLRCKCETTCLANCEKKVNQIAKHHGDNRNRNFYLHRWDLHFRNWRCLNVHRQDRRNGLKLANQIIAKISFIIPLKQKFSFWLECICMELCSQVSPDPDSIFASKHRHRLKANHIEMSRCCATGSCWYSRREMKMKAFH